MNFFKKLCIWMDTLEKFNIEKKKMRREDRLGEVDYVILNKKDQEERIASKTRLSQNNIDKLPKLIR